LIEVVGNEVLKCGVTGNRLTTVSVVTGHCIRSLTYRYKEVGLPVYFVQNEEKAQAGIKGMEKRLPGVCRLP